MRRVFLSGLWLLPLMAWACGGSSNFDLRSSGAGGNGAGGNGSGAGTPGSGNLPCDVADVVKAKCQNCHSAQPIYGAPMPLVTAADFAAPGKSDPSKTMAELAGARIHDKLKPMPPPPTKLDAAELDVMDAWIAAGAPGGTDSCSGSGGGGGGGGAPPLNCTPDVSLRAKTAWTMPKTTGDEYVCIGADVVVSEKKHITAISPVINNNVILHHMLLYEVNSTYNPEPTPCGAGAPNNSRLVSVWAPGGQTMEFPPEAGMPVEGTKHYMMQMHYSNLMQLEGQTDLSGFDMCTTNKLRANDADIMAFGTLQFEIPPNGELDRTCDLTVPSVIPQINVFYAMPHMHKLGTVISGEIQHAGGGTTVLSDRQPWSFDDQYWDKVSTTIKPGDKVRVRCAWQNPTQQSIGFGEATNDEMCYLFAAYYPRVTLPVWNWGAPAAGSQCVNTP